MAITIGTAASLLGMHGVICGAFGSHYLRSRLSDDQHRSWGIAVQYQLLHAIAMFAAHVALRREPNNAALRRAALLWGAGTAVFSGSIYLLSLGYRGILGPLTPVGGTLMIAGWGAAAVACM